MSILGKSNRTEPRQSFHFIQAALKGGRKIVQRLEARAKELENQLDDEQRRMVENQKNHR